MELNTIKTYEEDEECWFCGGIGTITYSDNNTKSSDFIICNACDASWISTWCTNCQRGRIIEIPPQRQKTYEWKCKKCKTKNSIAPGTYLHPIAFSPTKFSSRPITTSNDHITIPWINIICNWWDNQRHIFLYLLFGTLVVIMIMGVFNFSHPVITTVIALAFIFFFVSTVFMDVSTLIVSKLFTKSSRAKIRRAYRK